MKFTSVIPWRGRSFPVSMQVQQWSRIGRLRRNIFPKLTGGGHVFGGGASPGVMMCLAGRLLCDTYLSGEGKRSGLSCSHMLQALRD